MRNWKFCIRHCVHARFISGLGETNKKTLLRECLMITFVRHYSIEVVFRIIMYLNAWQCVSFVVSAVLVP